MLIKVFFFVFETMQEVCSSLDSQMGAQIKSESPLNSLQSQQTNQLGVQKIGQKDGSYWMTSESGFINSQPSIADFLTHLSPDSDKMAPQGYPNVPSDGMDGVPEYPWMKEKKTARKNNSQGKNIFFY